MSLSSLIGKLSAATQIQNVNLNTSVHQDIDNLSHNLNKLVDRTPEPYTFIQSNNNCLSSNVADGILIIQSPPMRHGERGVISDLNVNFTTVAGTVRIVKINPQGSVLVDLVRGVNSSTSGTGATVLEEGECIAVVGQTAGAGIFGVFFSGTKVKVDTY